MRALCSISFMALALLACGPRSLAAGPPPDPTIAPWELADAAQWPRWRPLPVLRGHEYALPVLGNGLAHPDARVRARCAFLMGQIGSLKAIPLLARALQDADRDVRIFCGLALCMLGHDRGLPAARAALVGTPWWVRYYAVIGLWHVGGERAKAAIGSALRDVDDLVRAAASAALSGAPPTPAANPEAFEVDEPTSLDEFIVLADNYLVGESDWWFHRGDYEQALRCHEAGVFLDPTFVELFDVAGWLYWSLGRNAEAVGAYRRGIQANPASWQACFSLGYHYFNLGRFDAALPYLARACELGAPPLLAHTYAHALEKAGRLEDSLREWERLRALEPDSHIVPRQVERLKRLLRAE